jgi:putative glycosyltransferase (TIGR04372 family)
MFYKLFQKLNYIKKFPYFICTPLVYGIGAASEHIAMASAHAKRTNKKLLLFKTYYFKKTLNYEICNNALFESLVFNNHKPNFLLLYYLIDFLIQIEFVFRRFLAINLKSFFKIDMGEEFRFALIGSRDLYAEKKFTNYNNLLPISIKESEVDLQEKEKEDCKKLLKQYDLSTDRIVCLHVRDHGYYNDLNRRGYRNSDINNYIGVIEYLINKNYLVVRLGNKSANKLNFKHKNFIDYPFTDLKSEIMDLFLIKECNFYIGTPSGPLDTAWLFNKPTLTTNLYDIYPSFPRKSIDRGVFRKIIRKENGKILSLNEFAKLNINYHQTEVNINELYFEENSSNELVEATKEFVINYESSENYKKNFQFDNKQISFNKLLNERLEEIYNDEVLKNDYFKNDLWKKNEFLKIVKRFKSCEGTFSLSTLKNLNL